MFEAGSIVWRIQTVGKDVLKQDLQQSEAAAKSAGVALDGAGKKTKDLGDKAQAATPQIRTARQEITQMSQSAQQTATSVGRSMVVIGAAIVAASALTVKAAIDWESAWTGVTKTVDGTPEELAAIEDGLRGLAKVLPASHTEIAAVAEAAGQLGVQSKNVVAFTKTMIDLGETTNLSANDAATALARFMNVMGTSQDKVSNLGSAVVELGNNYATTEAEIVAMASRLSGAARQVGLTEGQTVGLAAALSSVGIEAEAGGSAVSKVMIDIAASVDKGGERVEKFAKVSGMSADEFSKKWKTDPGAALAAFVKGLADAESQGGTTLGMLEELGITETRMRDALLKSAAASDQFTAAMKTGDKAFDDNIALQNEAQKRYDTTASKIDMAKNAFVDMAIGMGEQLLPAVVAVADGVQSLSGFIGGMPPEVQGTIAVLGLLTGGIILVGGVMLIAVPKIVAFKQAVSSLKDEFPKATANASKFSNFLTGPWGLAISLAAIGIGHLIQSNAEYQARVEDLTGTLEKNTGAFTKNTRASVAKSLQDQGAYKAAEKLGISVETLTDAALGNADALDEVNTKTAKYSTENAFAENAVRIFGQSVVSNILGPLNGEIVALDGAEDSRKNLNAAEEEGAKTTKTAASAYLDAQKEVAGLAQQLDTLIDTLNKANGVGQDAITKNIDYQQTLADVDEQIQRVKAGTDGYTATLDETTKAGRDNKNMLVDLAKDAWDAATAQHDLDGNTEAYRQRLVDSRDALITRAMDLGATREEAEKLADQILKIPSETEWTFIANTAAAQTELDKWIERNSNRSIRIAIGAGGAGGITQADGGKVNFYAQGGRENHIAQFAKAGTTRVWAEPETGGEWYIPAAPAKRQRSTQILSEAASEFGYTLVSKSGSSAPSSASSGAGRGGPTDLSDSTIKELVRGIATAVRLDSRGGLV